MAKILPAGAPAPESRSDDYSMAIEYHGPPISYEIPCAVPIEIERIPVASIAGDSLLTGAAALPVVQPLPSPVTLKPPPPPLAGEPTASSPTSVIAFQSQNAAISGEVKESSGEVKESECSWSDAAPGRASTDSALSSDFGFPSSASNEDEPTITSPVKRATVVTFKDSAESTSTDSPVTGIQQQDSEIEPRIKKGACYRCSRGNRFTEKEVCLVCDAKYCSRCVLRAMGSMPEGRKCVSCIGFPIEESKRERLGKSSGLLKRLLSSLEVQQVMKAERECEENQMRADYVCVNRNKLTQEEMVLLQSCLCPPTKLKPGYYWYDKVSGFWGKEGCKPHQIISPHLNVGGCLMRNASNGNTGILINGRDITKVELRMLQWAGVQCAGSPHFWVNADGTYQEEGQNYIKGQIWGKSTMKLICSILSLPIPSKAVNLSGEKLHNIVTRAVPSYIEQRAIQKLLLLGHHGSGTSTIFKQAKFLYRSVRSVPFSEEERQSIKMMIQSNVYTYLGIILEGRERFEEESLLEKMNHSSNAGNDESGECGDATGYSIPPRLKAFSDWLLKVMASGDLDAIFPAATREHAPMVEELWKNSAIQATYARRSELRPLPTNASYFLERVVDISRADYMPSDTDILYVDGITPSNGLTCTDLFFPQLVCDGKSSDSADQADTLVRYQLIRLHTKGLRENHKWLDMFEDVRMVVFCVSAIDYDEHYEDANGESRNKMMESKWLFERMVSHPVFAQMDFLLVLNKFDLLERKMDCVHLNSCEWFRDFDPVVSRHGPSSGNRRSSSSNPNMGASKAQQAFHYIAVKFKRLFASLTARKLYVTSANGLDSDSVDATLRYAREILKWEEERPVFGSVEYSAYSTDPSSYSH